MRLLRGVVGAIDKVIASILQTAKEERVWKVKSVKSCQDLRERAKKVVKTRSVLTFFVTSFLRANFCIAKSLDKIMEVTLEIFYTSQTLLP